MDKELLKALGITGGVLIALTAIGVGIFAYKTYLEVKQTKLEISKLQLQLSNPDGIKNGNVG